MHDNVSSPSPPVHLAMMTQIFHLSISEYFCGCHVLSSFYDFLTLEFPSGLRLQDIRLEMKFGRIEKPVNRSVKLHMLLTQHDDTLHIHFLFFLTMHQSDSLFLKVLLCLQTRLEHC
jgi:hypothetical protein